MSRKKITLYISSSRGDVKNTSFPFKVSIENIQDMEKAAAFDHVCGEYADGKNTRGRIIKAYRNEKTFRRADCLPMDCDNTNPNPLLPDLTPEQWKRPEDVQKAFPNVAFYVVYSRNNEKVKDGLPARPKFHVYFVMDMSENSKYLKELKAKVQEYFPSFDPQALDAARLLFGVENPKVEYFDGELTINQFMNRLHSLPEVIPVGERNSTLSRYAARILKKYGDSKRVAELFRQAADRCEQPLEESELQTIWGSAVSFFHRTVETDPDYIPPDEYAAMEFEEEQGEKKAVTSDDIKRILKQMNLTVRLNVITGMVDIQGMPSQYSKTNAANTMPVLVMDYMKRHNMKCTRLTLDDCLVLIEDENRYNPVEEMLKSTVYDGVDRIEELKQILGVDHSARESMYLTKWLHQSVFLALNDDEEPAGGDGVLVIQADQGEGKTHFFSKLAMKTEWFAEGVSIDVEKKDSIIQATNRWIAELGELDSTLKRQQSALKAFLTAKVDTYRQPYARVAVTKPRRTSFCATVNPQEFLNDETGSRRFWVVHPTKIDCERVKKLSPEWLAQLWRQVYEQFYLKNPQGFRLSQEERAELQRENEKYSKPLPGETELLDLLAWDHPVEEWAWYTTTQVKEALQLRTLNTGQVGKALTKLCKKDERILTKSPGNSKRYLLPPLRRNARYYQAVEDFVPLVGA